MKFDMKKILIAALLLLSACGGTAFEDDGKLHVVTTVGMLGDMVENIGGDNVVAKSLMGPGVDPHLYKASAGDIALMEEADVIFYVGLHLEGKMVEIFEELGKKKPVYAIENGLDHELLVEADAFGGTHDPHVWFDVGLWASTIPYVWDVLIENDPDNQPYYIQNGQNYRRKLLQLDVNNFASIEDIPEEQRLLVTAHDAFGYFGKAYGMEVMGIQGISTASDYGLKDLENLIDIIVEREIKAVFVESSVSKKGIEALREGVRARGWELEIGGELFSDAMGAPGTEEGTYLGMVQHNVDTIVNALK